MLNSDNQYTKMQKEYYEAEAKRWTPDNRDPVVGSYDAHNAWEDYELLFKGMDTIEMIALDYGCGPGRCLEKYKDRFKEIIGCDISVNNIVSCFSVGVKASQCNGVDLRLFEDNWFDLVYSVICLQHIAVHDIRFNIMKEICRVLKPGGVFTFQMGYGGKEGYEWVEWNDNKYDAKGTNGMCDVSITDEKDVWADLHKAGFSKVEFSDLRPTGPGDAHKNWIFIKAWK